LRGEPACTGQAKYSRPSPRSATDAGKPLLTAGVQQEGATQLDNLASSYKRGKQASHGSMTGGKRKIRPRNRTLHIGRRGRGGTGIAEVSNVEYAGVLSWSVRCGDKKKKVCAQRVMGTGPSHVWTYPKWGIKNDSEVEGAV